MSVRKRSVNVEGGPFPFEICVLAPSLDDDASDRFIRESALSTTATGVHLSDWPHLCSFMKSFTKCLTLVYRDYMRADRRLQERSIDCSYRFAITSQRLTPTQPPKDSVTRLLESTPPARSHLVGIIVNLNIGIWARMKLASESHIAQRTKVAARK